MHRTAIDTHGKREARTDAILRQVARVLNHRSFARSQCPARILRTLGERLLLHGRRPITQLELARVLQLPSDFDPARNPLVRIHIGKLRRMLTRYNEGDGRYDPVSLVVPRKSYRLEGFINDIGVDEQPRIDGDSSSPSARDTSRTVILVSEFAAAETSLQTLTRCLALWLMPEVLDIEGIAAIGPLLLKRDGTDRSTWGAVARRHACDFILDGDCRHGGRGIEIVLRIIDANDGAVIWTDWLDEPAVAADDGCEPMAQMIAARVTNALRRHWTSHHGFPTAGDREGVGQLAGGGTATRLGPLLPP